MKTTCLFALASLMTVSSALAVTIPVTSGSIVVDFNAAALASVNIGSDPNIGGLILEEFFRGNEDRNRTRDQIMADHIVPNYTAIPATSLKFEINGTTVTNLAGRTRQPSTFSYDPANVTGTAGTSTTSAFPPVSATLSNAVARTVMTLTASALLTVASALPA